MRVIDEIAAERRRQIEEEGYTASHDDRHTGGEIARAAAAFAYAASLQDDQRKFLSGIYSHTNHLFLRDLWPRDWGRLKLKDRRRDLIRAGALIVAEIQRLDAIPDAEPTGDAA